MRELDVTLLDRVVGGTTFEEEIIVSGRRQEDYVVGYIYWPGFNNYTGPSSSPNYGYSGWGTSSGYSDTSSHDIDMGFNRTLTEAESNAINEFKEAAERTSNFINAIPDNAQITLSDGSKVSGLELKQAWAKTDFRINEAGTTYANGAQTSQSDYNGGNPQISININTLTGYNAHGDGGMNYLILHEVAHLTAANRAFDANSANSQTSVERMANDIARAIANYSGGSIMSSPTYGYSGTTPLVFTTPPPTGGGGGGGGGGLGGPQPY